MSTAGKDLWKRLRCIAGKHEWVVGDVYLGYAPWVCRVCNTNTLVRADRQRRSTDRRKGTSVDV